MDAIDEKNDGTGRDSSDLTALQRPVTRIEELGLLAVAERFGLMGSSGPTILAARWIREVKPDADMDDLYTEILDAVAKRLGGITLRVLFEAKLSELHRELIEIEQREIARREQTRREWQPRGPR